MPHWQHSDFVFIYFNLVQYMCDASSFFAGSQCELAVSNFVILWNRVSFLLAFVVVKLL